MSPFLVVKPDNFTPKTRTPWAGTFICRNIKETILPDQVGLPVGESWELSCDPSFASEVDYPEAFKGQTLQDIIEAHPQDILSPYLFKKLSHETLTCEILVKFVNAAENLSLQVHPEDDNQDLQPGECGKPESWYVLHAEEGAGIYLGFAKSMAKPKLKEALGSNANCKELLEFVPVKSGDYFEIPPGVPHSIGAGVTILEPQRVIKGKSGKTYRMWDWGRQYDGSGNKVDSGGEPRELHLEEALKLVDPTTQVGSKFVDSLRRVPKVTEVTDGVRLSTYEANPYYQVLIMESDKEAKVKMAIKDGFAVAVVLNSELGLKSKSHSTGISLAKGNTSMLGYAAFPLEALPRKATKVAFIIPSTATMSVSV